MTGDWGEQWLRVVRWHRWQWVELPTSNCDTVHHGHSLLARGRLPEGVPDLIAIMGNVGRSAFSVRRALADAVGAVPRFRALRDEAWVAASDSSS